MYSRHKKKTFSRSDKMLKFLVIKLCGITQKIMYKRDVCMCIFFVTCSKILENVQKFESKTKK